LADATAPHYFALIHCRFLHSPKLPNVCAYPKKFKPKVKEEGTNYRNISNHIMEVRACGFLDNTRLSVDAIAAQMGFQDAANFWRAFKSWQGCSPRDYRIRSSTFES
jgi:AraC-like DNA-binding protein